LCAPLAKRLGTPYRSGRVEHWLKIKNPAAPAVKREAIGSEILTRDEARRIAVNFARNN
jgi:hypothetical protein